ncbi:sensor domain-containing protein [Actinoplanes sp. NEAU-A12]|uniref:Sensor domain-containing protein n=1 Tax=Actinoplanes sandaracinus TaxID=3045177 RepID=A0ABT6WRM8_9ACTN|nr:sensor domain-containing protein [Actinoplanes sandaracinus]MDI6102401.1 sensor domain-containing protein [Actinoplanes sandaracinus]
MTTTQLDPVLTPAPVARILPRLAADTRYVLTGLPLGLAAALVCATGLAVGLGLAVLWVGVPLMMFALMQARGFAAAERERIAAVLGHEIPAPAYRGASASTLPARVLAVLADAQTWRDLAHATLRLIPNTLSFSLVASWWAAVVGGLSWVLWGWSLPNGPGDDELPEILGLGDGYLTNVTFYLLLAVPFALTLPAVARWAARFEARFAERLLAGR